MQTDIGSLNKAILQDNLRTLSPIRKSKDPEYNPNRKKSSPDDLLEKSPASPPTMPNTVLKSFSSITIEKSDISEENSLKVLSRDIKKLGEEVNKNIHLLQDRLEVNKKLTIMLYDLEKKVSEKKKVFNESASQEDHCQKICTVQ